MSIQYTENIFYRIEKKYLVTRKQYNEITKILSERMALDEYSKEGGTYNVMSLYYDTPSKAFICEALFNRRYKEKLRLRTYTVPQPDADVFVEVKKKVDGIGNKRRCTLPLADAYRFLEKGDISYEGDNQQVLREIYAILGRYDMNLSPSALISYNRLAYNGKDEDVGLRISFDTDLRGRLQDLRFESGTYGKRLLDPEVVVMEIKVLSCMPLWLTQLLASQQVFPRSFSKYRAMHRIALNSKEMIFC